MTTEVDYDSIADSAVIALGINPEAVAYGIDFDNKAGRRIVNVSRWARRAQKRAAHKADRRAFKGARVRHAPGNSWNVY